MSPIRPENRGRYPEDWKSISARIRERAGNRCECEGECGRGHVGVRCVEVGGERSMTGGERTITVLTTAHLDHTPENCEPSNLKAMCQGCHLHYDREHHRRTRLARERRERAEAGQLTLLSAGFLSPR